MPKRQRKTKTRRGYNVDKAAFNNEIDDFADSRDKILLDKAQPEAELSDEEQSDEPVLDLDPAVVDSGADDDEIPGQADASVEDDDGVAKQLAQKEEQISKQWGQKRGAYHGADTVDYEIESDEEVAVNEESEARRLQKEQAQSRKAEDYDANLEMLITDEAKPVTQLKKSSKQKRSDKDLLKSINDDLSNLSGEMEVEKIEKDVSKLTKEEKMEIILSDSPELPAMLEEFKSSIKELREHIIPVLRRVNESKLPTSKGISFLEVHFHLLLTYCINLAFYCRLKAEGKQIKDHPVIDQLAHLREMLDKMPPIQKKLKYQIDKLLKMTSGEAKIAEEDSKDETIPDIDSKALRLKPNPSALLPRESLDDLEEKDQEEGDGIYRPPKLNPVTFEENEKEAKKNRAKLEKERKRALSSSAISALRDEILDRPEEQTSTGSELKETLDRGELEKRKFEEETFTRLMMTKEERKKAKQKQRINAFEDFGDFGDLAGLTGKEDDFGSKDKGKSKIEELKEKYKNQKKKVSFEDEDIQSSDDLDEGMDFYDEVKTASQSRKKAKTEKYAKAAEQYLQPNDPDMMQEEGKRRANKKMLDNRGLTRRRPKEQRNPRVRHRKKFAEAQKKRNSQVREYRGQRGQGYSGEATGIKKTLTRGIKLG